MDIFVSIAPQKWLADNLGGELLTTRVLIDEGQDPHTFEPTPRLMTKISRAQLYFTLDMEFEHQLVNKLKSSVTNLTFIDSSRHVKKIPIEDTLENMTEHVHNMTEHVHHTSDETLDPHIWLSPRNLKIMAKNMAEALILADPENSDDYTKNLDTLNTRLDQLHQSTHQQLAPFAGQTFYVFHPSFGYFAHDYALHQKAVEVGGKAPRPKKLSQLIAQAKRDNVKVIFVQPQFDPKSASAIAQAIDGEVASLNPLAENVVDNLEIMTRKIKNALNK